VGAFEVLEGAPLLIPTQAVAAGAAAPAVFRVAGARIAIKVVPVRGVAAERASCGGSSASLLEWAAIAPRFFLRAPGSLVDYAPLTNRVVVRVATIRVAKVHASLGPRLLALAIIPRDPRWPACRR